MTLSQAVTTYFNLSELHTMAFDFGIDWEDIPGRTKSEKAIGVIENMTQRNRLGDLLNYLQSERSHVPWNNLQLTR